MKNKKGFTLVELLAVIVILAIVMLMALGAVAPLMERSRKSALGDEALTLVNAAKYAYQTEQMASTQAGVEKITPVSSVCFSLQWLNNNQYYEKGTKDGYSGSVAVIYKDGSYTYKFWISNGMYVYSDVDVNNYGYDLATSGTTAVDDCGGASYIARK